MSLPRGSGEPDRAIRDYVNSFWAPDEPDEIGAVRERGTSRARQARVNGSGGPSLRSLITRR